jgi:hypothetical protein
MKSAKHIGYRPLLHTLLIGACLGTVLAAPAGAFSVDQTNLVTDDQAVLTGLGYSPAASVDPNLINPWGVSYGPASPFWVSNQGSGTSTLYNGGGDVLPLVVSVPGSTSGPSGRPVRFSTARPASTLRTEHRAGSFSPTSMARSPAGTEPAARPPCGSSAPVRWDAQQSIPG